jgi:hypothetical protein
MIGSSTVAKSFYYTATGSWHAPMLCFCPSRLAELRLDLTLYDPILRTWIEEVRHHMKQPLEEKWEKY